MKVAFPFLLVVLLMSSFIPDNLREKLNEEMTGAYQMVADWEFKKLLHKLSYTNFEMGVMRIH